jgi:hypothetical protein
MALVSNAAADMEMGSINTKSSRETTFPVYIPESESRLTKEGPKPVNVYKQYLPRK